MFASINLLQQLKTFKVLVYVEYFSWIIIRSYFEMQNCNCNIKPMQGNCFDYEPNKLRLTGNVKVILFRVCFYFYGSNQVVLLSPKYFFSEKLCSVLGTILTSHTLWAFLKSKLHRDNPTVILIVFVLVTNLAFTAIVLPINCLALLRQVEI